MTTRRRRSALPRPRAGLVAAATALLLVLGAISVSAATVNVAAVDFVFQPATRTIVAGDVVRWSFSGDPHTVTSGAPGAPDGAFDSGVVEAGGAYQRTFNRPGTFRYFCQVHPEQMSGTIVVTAAETPEPTETSEPTSTPRPTPRPTAKPTVKPTTRPTASPTPRPTTSPSVPTATPVEASPTSSVAAASPTASPSATASAAATVSPSAGPSGASPAATASSPAPTPGPVDGEATGSIAPAAVAGVAALVLLGAGGLVLARRRRRT